VIINTDFSKLFEQCKAEKFKEIKTNQWSAKSKLTDPSNNVSFTLAKECDRSCAAV